tara:strand:+ start:122 stop:877 length:756 start_codon:yes stop_codon:yes gene_type:complete
MGVAGGPSIPQSGMQLNLDASNKKSSVGLGTTWFDVSGNGRDFTWSSAPTYNTRPVVGGYQQPDSIDAAMATGPASNSFDITTSSGASFIFYCTNDSLTSKSAFKWYTGDGSGADARGYFVHLPWNNSRIYFDKVTGYADSNGGSTRTSAGGGRVNTDPLNNIVNFFWVHAFTCSSDGATMKIYRDGAEIASRTNAGSNPTLISTGATVGGGDTYSSGWDAKMGAFLCYNRELSAAEVKQITAALRGRDGA